MQTNDPITVCAEPGYEAEARQLAETLCLDFSAEPAAGALRLTLATDGLSLGDGTVSLRGDLSALAGRIQPRRLREEYVVRAVCGKGKVGGERVIDATAGLGEDSFLLAAAGYEVELYERDPIIAALLADSLERAAEGEWAAS